MQIILLLNWTNWVPISIIQEDVNRDVMSFFFLFCHSEVLMNISLLLRMVDVLGEIQESLKNW